MKITVIGGGPGGLYFSILAKKANPEFQIDVYERNKADDAFGFGVVFSDETLSEFLSRDPKSYELIRSRFAYWDDLDIARDGQKVRITGNGFCGCSRKTLLQLLQQRCKEEGVNLHFEHVVDDLAPFQDADVIVACDGINSQLRDQRMDDFGTTSALQKNKFVWMGSTRPLDAFTYFFRNTPYGPIVAHTYQYEEGKSTWIFETSPETWEKAGFVTENEQDTIQKLSEFFKEELDGHGLISNRSHWRNFPIITNTAWHKDNIVLLGDAKATAHYSIGSGTKLAMECAIALADAITAHPNDIPQAFHTYEQSRRKRVEMIQHAAKVSLEWFEDMDRHIQQDFLPFAFGVMTRSKKVTLENLAIRDASFTDAVLNDFNKSVGNTKTPPAFTPYTLGQMQLQNRIVMAPMEQYAAQNGLVSDWHLVHYGSRATGGVGLILTEAVAVSEEGKNTLGCPLITTKEQINSWKKIICFIHQNSNTKIGIQLGHSGRRGAIKRPWEGYDQPLETPWKLLAPSPIPYSDKMPVPKEMDQQDRDKVIEQFRQAAKNAELAGFDMIELQANHGYLLASFLSPLTNQRKDEYGGTVANRLRFPLEVFRAVRESFDANRPISVRISAHDWADGGITQEEVLEIAKAFKLAGADCIDVSSGYTVKHQKPAYGRMYQTPFSDAIRNSVGIPVITAGTIQDIDQINTIILNRRADLVALGRPLLLDPGFVRNAQAYEQYPAEDIPKAYEAGITHLYPYKLSERKAVEGMKKALKPESHKK